MNTTTQSTMTASAGLYLYGHTTPGEGPYDLQIGERSQPDTLHDNKKRASYLGVEETEDHILLIKVLLLKSGTLKPKVVDGLTLRRIGLCWKRGGKLLSLRIKKRVSDSFLPPLSTGKVVGTCIYDTQGTFVLYTFPLSLPPPKPVPLEPKTIITPGDEEFDRTLASAKRTLRFSGKRGSDAQSPANPSGSLQ